MTPSMHYTGDLVSEKVQLKTMKKRRQTVAADQHYDAGNALLASMGGLGKDFLSMLSFCYDFDLTEEENFSDPGDDTLLHSIQKDIFELRSPSPEERRSVSEKTRSLQIHSCHSPMREVEVLRSNLLELFRKGRENGIPLEPRDILVMASDIDLYAPFIDAVFRSPDQYPVPYSIADRDIRSQSVLISVFLSLFCLNEKRFSSSFISDIISSPPLMRRFRLSEEDCDTLRSWIYHAGVRWGAGAQDRRDAVGISYDQNSFSQGMLRLLTGYMMHEEGALSGGILPADYVEGSSGDLLGRGAEIIRILSGLSSFMKSDHSAAEWTEYLLCVLDILFLSCGDDADDFSMIRTALRDMSSNAAQGGFSGTADYRIIRDYLCAHLDETRHQFGFLNGKVTFCAMLPMRSIPFRVICMLGMDDGVFPRTSKPLSFDLISRNPRRGDRSQRNDDRYLFLESVMSARDCLYISYNGRSIKDNSLIPPSVLVSELLDYVCGGYDCAGTEKTAQERILSYCVTQHPLQGFSPDCFNNRHSHLFSYSASDCRIASSSSEQAAVPALFSDALPPEIPEQLLTVDPESLSSFFANSVRFLMRSRLGIKLFSPGEEDTDNEPLEIDMFDELELENGIVRAVLEDESLAPLRERALCGGAVPPGEYGKLLYGSVERRAVSCAGRVKPFYGKDSLRADIRHTVRVSAGIDVTLRGALSNLTDKGLLRYRGRI
ncbi:MAG: exodeoxyribonuclease V subunit gamma, partial [Spirochaetota bacterium]